MFQFPHLPLSLKVRVPTHHGGGLPHSEISGSACKRLPGAYRSVTTSFFGPGCQGIHHLLLFACISPSFSLAYPLRLLVSCPHVAARSQNEGSLLLRRLELSSTFYSAFMVIHFTSC